MTRQHAPSDRNTELAVGEDLTVLSALYQDGRRILSPTGKLSPTVMASGWDTV